MKIIVKSISTLLFFLTIFIALYLYNLESIFSLDPEIDTLFTENFSKENYVKIKTGMTKDEVLRLLGKPFEEQLYASGGACLQESQSIFSIGDFMAPIEINFQLPSLDSPLEDTLSYSKDGACSWFDFAWLEYKVILIDGSVIRTEQCWHGD